MPLKNRTISRQNFNFTKILNIQCFFCEFFQKFISKNIDFNVNFVLFPYRRKSVRRSFRKKKTGEDGEPYSLLRKGSDKLKSLRAFKQAGKKREAGKK